MLLKNEIKIGEIYAWDTSVTEPKAGCNVFKLMEIEEHTDYDMGSSECCKYTTLILKSLDGKSVVSCGSHCLIPAWRALERLDVLRKAKPYSDNFHEYSYEKELYFLEQFESSFKRIIFRKQKLLKTLDKLTKLWYTNIRQTNYRGRNPT